MKRLITTAVAAASLLIGTSAHAGAFILAGTDSDDHGSQALLNSQDGGWFFMQRALENLTPNVTNGNKVVTILGSTSTAFTAASAAFSASNLGSNGWTLQTVSTGNFGNFFTNSGSFLSTGVAGSGLLMMDSGSSNVAGGVAGSLFNPYASTIDSFVDTGGALFSQSNGYSWLSALLPSIGVVQLQDTDLALTPAGSLAFPSLTNSDITTGPWHSYFTNIGALTDFADSTASSAGGAGRAVIIGSVGGSITNPTPVEAPEPGTLILLGMGLAATAAARKRKAT